MIQVVVIDMIPFMVIFVIGVVAFADSFLSVKEILIAKADNGIDRDDVPDNAYGQYVYGYFKAW
jgi:hypothetical protein